MTTLFAITPIGNENVPVAKDSKPIDATPVTKTDVKIITIAKTKLNFLFIDLTSDLMDCRFKNVLSYNAVFVSQPLYI